MPFIREQLERLVPPDLIEDQGGYIEVPDLRLIVFKKRTIRDLKHFESVPETDWIRDAGDKEVYLHIRLPDLAPHTPDEIGKAFEDLSKALEIQGHIKKGLDGINTAPMDLLTGRNTEELQSMSKSAMKALKACDLWYGKEGATRKNVEPVAQMLQDIQYPRKHLTFENQLEMTKVWGYLNPPLVGITPRTIRAYQQAVAGALQLADKRAAEKADAARARLEEWRKRHPNDPRLEPLVIASRLYDLQRGINRPRLFATPAPSDTVQALLEHFDMPAGSSDAFFGTGVPNTSVASTRWGGAGSSMQTRTYAIVTWENYGSPDPARKPCRPEHRAGITLLIAEFGSEQAAQDALEARYRPQAFQREAARTKQAADRAEREARQNVNARVQDPRTRDIRIQFPYTGGTQLTEKLGTSLWKRTTIDMAEPRAVLSTDLLLRSRWRLEQHTKAELLTPPEQIEKMKKNAAVAAKYSSIPVSGPVVIDARYRVTEHTRASMLEAEQVKHRTEHGVCRFGKCLVFVQRQSAYRPCRNIDQDQNVTYAFPDQNLAEWAPVKRAFLALARQSAPPERIRIALRLDGLDSVYRAVAADGVSRLKFVAEITGSERALSRIRKGGWELREPERGRIRQIGGPRRAGANRHIVEGEYVPPEAVPHDVGQGVRLVLVGEEGNATYSEWITFNVVSPPILMVHGIWSGPAAMRPLRDHLVKRGLTTPARCRLFDYADTTTKSLLLNARALRRNALDSLLETCRRKEKIKVERVNIVAHSLGGLISRLVVQGRWKDSSLPGDGHRVLKLITIATPHQGSAVADWYSEWQPAGFTDETDPSAGDFQRLRAGVILLLNTLAAQKDEPGMNPQAFQFGSAVLALRSHPNIMLDRLNMAARSPPEAHRHVRFYFIAGTIPFFDRGYAEEAATVLYWTVRSTGGRAAPSVPSVEETVRKIIKDTATKQAAGSLGWMQTAWDFAHSLRFREMVTELCYMVTDPQTDGVVHPNSALPEAYFRGRFGGKKVLPSNHFGILVNPHTHAQVAVWLGADGSASSGRSPSHAATRGRGDSLSNRFTRAHARYREARKAFLSLLSHTPIEAPEDLRSDWEDWHAARRRGDPEEIEMEYDYLLEELFDADISNLITRPASLRNAQTKMREAWRNLSRIREQLPVAIPEEIEDL